MWIVMLGSSSLNMSIVMRGLLQAWIVALELTGVFPLAPLSAAPALKDETTSHPAKKFRERERVVALCSCAPDPGPRRAC